MIAMLYQDRRALRVIRNCVMWLGAVVTPLPILSMIPASVVAIAALSAAATLVTVYLMLLAVIAFRA